jgi:hypothetical protein
MVTDGLRSEDHRRTRPLVRQPHDVILTVFGRYPTLTRTWCKLLTCCFATPSAVTSLLACAENERISELRRLVVSGEGWWSVVRSL